MPIKNSEILVFFSNFITFFFHFLDLENNRVGLENYENSHLSLKFPTDFFLILRVHWDTR